MKSLLLCVLCLLPSPTQAQSPIETSELTQELTSPISSFNADDFLKLIEEYTNFTKTEPKNGSEEPAIASLIGRLADTNAQIETEIKNTRLLNNAAVTKKLDDRLKQYNDSAKTALKELYKRESLVKALAKNSLEFLDPLPSVNSSTSFFSTVRLSAPYQFVKNIFPAQAHIKDCLLHSPMLTSC